MFSLRVGDGSVKFFGLESGDRYVILIVVIFVFHPPASKRNNRKVRDFNLKCLI